MKLKESLKYLKLHEATISMLLGVLVIVFSGVILVNYFAQRRNNPQPVIEIGDEQSTEVTHTVQKGEDLWKIAQNYLGDGNEWKKIAELNGITDANQIKEGDTLKIPQISPSPEPTQIAAVSVTLTPTLTKSTSSTPTATKAPSPTNIPTTKVSPTPAATVAVTQTPTPTVVTTDGQGAISTEAKSHTVAKGENLWIIAEKYFKSGYNWSDISNANKLVDPSNLKVGQTLMIPNVAPKKETVITTAQTNENAISGNSYKVEKGDNLWNIAVRAYGDGYKWSEIARENKIANPNIIHVGTTLTLPR